MLRLYPAGRDRAPVADTTGIYDNLTLPPPPPDRPYMLLNMVSTVDGKITLGGGRVQEIGSDLDHTLMRRLRMPVDAVLRGAGTVRAHGRYPCVDSAGSRLRSRRGLEPQPLAVVVTASGDLPLDAPLFTRAPRRPVVFTGADAPAAAAAALAEFAEVHRTASGRVDLRQAMSALRQRYGVRYLLSEGGPALNFDCLRAGLLDEIFWTVAPRVGGDRGDLTMVEGPGVLRPLPGLQLISAYLSEDTGELFLRYRVDVPAS